MLRTLFAATIIVSGAASTMAPPARAADSCGWFAFGGAFKSLGQAQRRADRIGGAAFGLDASDSPNAGKGLWVVAYGATSRGEARRQSNRWRARGIKAYVARRCFYGE